MLLSVAAFVGVALLLVGELGLNRWVILVGLLLAIILAPALGVVIIRNSASLPLPWWCGVALIAWGLALAFSASSGAASPRLSAILVAAPLMLVGYAIYRAGIRLDEELSQGR